MTTTTERYAACFTAADLIRIIQPGEIIGNGGTTPGAISTDTRSLKPGQWYLALKGENFDGHRFTELAIKGGAAGCIVSSLPDSLELPEGVVLMRVQDTLVALHKIATDWRRQVDPFVIAVTGSSGKTTTKEMCAAAVSSVSFHKSAANENNEFGVPKTILSMPPETKVLVLEMAMRGLNQIALLAETGEPDAGIITGVGTAHIELLGSRQNIIKAKCELFEKMSSDSVGIIGDPGVELVARAREVFEGELKLFSTDDVEETEVSAGKTVFTVRGSSVKFTVNAHGIRHLQDAWCAVMAARAAGISDEHISFGLATYNSVEGRGNRIALANGGIVVDESYNANPDSVKCAVLAVLDSRAFPQSDKYIVLGEMAELGAKSDELHAETGAWLKDQKFTALVTVGSKAAQIADAAAGADFTIHKCNDQDEALALLKRKAGRDTCIMIKGSHCANLDRLVTDLRGK